ncbi:MAG: EF-P lysine aminoacylase GenX [Candidatus Magasanikbacteria bacterium]|nr:EF-P lysine aminoacylase GenX [Candidatus Magasanikbacteria bacterium]
MQQIQHIRENKEYLLLRSRILSVMRDFFNQRRYIEADVPVALAFPGQEPYLNPMPLVIHDEKGESHRMYLHTSPEYTLKKMLAAGFERVFSITKCFRDYESFGGNHNPEFTMLEWYSVKTDMFGLMDEMDALFGYLKEKLGNELKGSLSIAKRIRMRDLWFEIIGVDLDDYLESGSLFDLCRDFGFNPSQEESYEDLFYRIFLNKIEPLLKNMGTVFVHHYPVQMAALSKISMNDPRYAERVEVYLEGTELANGFSELTDSKEQLRRLEAEKERRKEMNKETYDIDREFVEAVGLMPESAGIALGVDRLVQYCAACKDIDNVLVLPMSKLTSGL